MRTSATGRTAALGGFDWVCDTCGHHQHLYHACRDRHCPRCQRSAFEQWCERQREAVLPVTYYHVVFTLPHDLNPWVELQPRLIYALLFASVWATLSAFAADPKRLDGRLGMTAVLHTWGQTLTRHVHLHCLIPGGAIGADGTWHAARSTMLFPVRARSRHVRGGLVSRLRAAAKAGALACIAPAEIDAMLDRLMRADWVVYAKPCVSGARDGGRLLGPLQPPHGARSHGLADGRLLGFDGEHVQLAYKDYRDGDKRKIMTLDAEELLRRFLLHVLPTRFMRIRHLRIARQPLPQPLPGVDPHRAGRRATAQRQHRRRRRRRCRARPCAARCPRGPMPEKPRYGGPPGPRQLPMTRAPAPGTRATASRRRQRLVVHGLAGAPARNTIPHIRHRLTPHTRQPDAGLGQFNDS